MTAPARIQRRRTRGWRKPAGAIYVGRGSQWGNPFVLQPAAFTRGGRPDMWAVKYEGQALGRWDDKGAARADAAERYGRWIREPEQHALRALVRQVLHGQDLMCWCPPGEPCHADVLLEIANAPARDRVQESADKLRHLLGGGAA